ncbi:MAG: hypothetical protein KJ737_10235 [Proteobacteria bacterium]|nr:hypothetical protein [Pseudomonadota bacterium]
MKNYMNKRSFTRYTYEVPVQIFTGARKGDDFLNEKCPSLVASLSNYSRGGMYLESEYSIPQGTSISINLVRPEIDTATGIRKNYHAKVIWCKKIIGSAMPMYGIGAMYEKFGNDAVFGFGKEKTPVHRYDKQMFRAYMRNI